MVAAVVNTFPLPPPDTGILVHVPDAPDFWKRRFVMFGCATPPSLYTASITSEGSGANNNALHSKVIVLSMTAVVHGGEVPVLLIGSVLVPNPFVQVAAMSALVERPTEQSTSCSI